MTLKTAIRRIKITAMLALGVTIAHSAGAQSLEEALMLAEDGDNAGAIAMLRTLEAAQPKNADIPYQLGQLLSASGNDTEAAEALETSRRLGNREATLALAALANTRLETAQARELLEAYRSSLKKGKKTLGPDNSGDLDERIDRTENMLGRVENIEIIDSMVVDADTFFRHYRLSPESGSLNAPADVLPERFTAADPTVVYEPESRREMIWATPDTTGTFRLFSSAALTDGQWERPAMLGSGGGSDDSVDLGEGGDANYPFLMPDGITLYFANDGENSIGGLDIFISRRGDNGFLQPQNLGMPYNSPYDDYMLAIDELTGVGWWATDRNRIPGKVTIYVFIPSELRQNIDPDDPTLTSRARIDAIRDSWRPDTDRRAIVERIVALNNDPSTRPVEFTIAIPGRGVYTNYADFRTPAAREAMHTYMDSLNRFNEAMANLQKMREAFAKGDTRFDDLILRAEEQISASRAELQTLRNDVITLER